MKTLFLDCNMGASGDMLTGTLLELLPDSQAFLDKLTALQLPGVTVRCETSAKCGITGTHFTVMVHGEEEKSMDLLEHYHHEHDHEHHQEHEHHHEHHQEHHQEHYHEHHHSDMAEIAHIVEHLAVSDKVKRDILAVYKLIGEAESHVHGQPVEQIHFHEVGSLDAVMDITAVCLLMEMLSPEQVVVTPIHVGFGQVRCAHGILPVPAPATAWLLRDVPISSGDVQGELCTPTGAALLRYFATSYGQMPPMKVSRIGYGLGTKEFPVANCLRSFLGETLEEDADQVVELNCTIDDMTGEELAFATKQLFQAGACDVFTTAVQMKKNRPGTLLTVLCHPAHREAVLQAFFQHTSTLGVRQHLCHRAVLTRSIEEQSTPLGVVRVKQAVGYGVHKEKVEAEDLERMAAEHNMSLTDIKRQIPPFSHKKE